MAARRRLVVDPMARFALPVGLQRPARSLSERMLKSRFLVYSFSLGVLYIGSDDKICSCEENPVSYKSVCEASLHYRRSIACLIAP